MRIRQARKIIDVAHREKNQPTGRVMRALRTIWHRSRFKDGKRMGGLKSDKYIKLIAEVLLGKIKVNSYGKQIGEK